MNHWQNKNINDIAGEVWRELPNYNGKYVVSNKARVKNTLSNKIVIQHKRRGYLSLTLFDENNISYYTKAHKLVGICFVLNPYNKQNINHKDFDRENNLPENLEWVTSQENMDHMKAAGRSLFGIKNPSVILSEKDVSEIKICRPHMKVKDIAEKFGVSIPTIEKIIYGRTWKHLI